MPTWNEKLAHEMEAEGDDGANLVKSPNEDAWTVEFDDGYGGSEGPAVLAWTETRVYFPVVYDGSEWLGSAPRNPQPEGQPHVGGE